MKRKKLTRIVRSRKVTPAEIARDEEIRRKVMIEFPPANPKARRAGR